MKVALQTVIFALVPMFVYLVIHHIYLIVMDHAHLNLPHYVQLVYTSLMGIALVYAHQDIGPINYLKSVSNVLKIVLNVQAQMLAHHASHHMCSEMVHVLHKVVIYNKTVHQDII